MQIKLNQLFMDTLTKNKDILCICLSTEDGFLTCLKSKGDFAIEEDKLSAVSTSIIALSNSASLQLLESSLIRTVIETKQGDMFLSRTKLLKKNMVLCVVTIKKNNHAISRYVSLELAKSIELLKN